jgi:hypothetical protein
MRDALEALDAILQGVDGGTLTTPEAIEELASGADLPARAKRRALQSRLSGEAAARV